MKPLNTLKKLIESIFGSFSHANAKDDLVIGYKKIRNLIGIIGILFPLILICIEFAIGDEQTIKPSISHYYIGVTRDVFVGFLWCIAVFMYSYRGNSKGEMRLTSFAGLCLVLLTVFPTEMGQHFLFKNVPFLAEHVTMLHFAFGALFFLCTAFISFFVFCEDHELTEVRKNVHKTAGTVILACVLTLAGMRFLDVSIKLSTLILEIIMLIAFGVSWLNAGIKTKP